MGRATLLTVFDSRGVLKTAGIAGAAFVALGTVTALWENPLFFRMTPAGWVEIGLLAIQSVLLGLYFALRRIRCAARPVGVGSVLTFLGVACPVCNKILLFVFGSELLLVYFEPVRVYVAAIGVLVTVAALWLRWALLVSPPEKQEAP